MDGMRGTTAVALKAVNHAYGKCQARRQVLFDLSLEIFRGEVVFLMGPSGCGKTTVLTLVGALRSVQQGEVSVLGKDLAGATEAMLVQARRHVGFIFQGNNLHRSLTALQNVRMGLEARGEAGRPDPRHTQGLDEPAARDGAGTGHVAHLGAGQNDVGVELAVQHHCAVEQHVHESQLHEDKHHREGDAGDGE